VEHLTRLATRLQDTLHIPVVIEPTRADAAVHVRILCGAPELSEIWQGDGTDIQYQADYPLTISARALGGNERLALTHQATALSLVLAEFFRESFQLAGERAQALDSGLVLAADCVVHNARRTQGTFSRLSEDEESTESRLFLWREDWTAELRTIVTRPHTPPVSRQVTYQRPDAPDLIIPGEAD
jgi:hypothetical protein